MLRPSQHEGADLSFSPEATFVGFSAQIDTPQLCTPMLRKTTYTNAQEVPRTFTGPGGSWRRWRGGPRMAPEPMSVFLFRVFCTAACMQTGRPTALPKPPAPACRIVNGPSFYRTRHGRESVKIAAISGTVSALHVIRSECETDNPGTCKYRCRRAQTPLAFIALYALETAQHHTRTFPESIPRLGNICGYAYSRYIRRRDFVECPRYTFCDGRASLSSFDSFDWTALWGSHHNERARRKRRPTASFLA